MKKIVLSLVLVLIIGFLFENESYANLRCVNSIVLRNIGEVKDVSITGRYRFLGQLDMSPHSGSAYLNVYTDGYSYYCSFYDPSEVEKRNEKDLRESGVFYKIYKDNRGYCYNDYYGEKSYLYNTETHRIVQNIEREVYYQDWMRN